MRKHPLGTMERIAGADAVLVFEGGRESVDFVAAGKTRAGSREAHDTACDRA